jgi:hypothetical protein
LIEVVMPWNVISLTQVTGGKRPLSSVAAGGVKGQQPCLSLTTALPLSVWQDHLMPWLSVGETARLRGVCRALRGVVAEYPVNVHGAIWLSQPEKALTCFPAAEGLGLYLNRALPPEEETILVESLRRGGKRLRRIRGLGEGADQVIAAAVLAGAMPRLVDLTLTTARPACRRLLSEGRLARIEELEVTVTDLSDKEQLTSLGHLRRLPSLRALTLSEVAMALGGEGEREWERIPPFLPPSLTALTLGFKRDDAAAASLLRGLPSMLQASGARLEAITVEVFYPLCAAAAGALAAALRTCSPTLRVVELPTEPECDVGLTPAFEALASGLAGCCGTLERLCLPWSVFHALLALGPHFPRLTHLHVSGRHALDLTSSVWAHVAGGCLPALTSLDLRACAPVTGRLEGAEGGGEGGSPFVRAFGALAGTLTHLTMSNAVLNDDVPPRSAGHELGAAIGRLRHIRYLSLGVSADGRTYHALARGMASLPSPPCPALFRVSLQSIGSNVDWLTDEPSLIVPSVRDLRSVGMGPRNRRCCCCVAWRGWGTGTGTRPMILNQMFGVTVHGVLACVEHMSSLGGIHLVT